MPDISAPRSLPKGLRPGIWSIAGWATRVAAGRERSRMSATVTATCPQIAQRYKLDFSKLVVVGHSAGGQLALCLAAHEASVKSVVSLAGVVDLQQAWELHLSNNAVVDFLGGEPAHVPEHYREADPMQLKIPRARNG